MGNFDFFAEKPAFSYKKTDSSLVALTLLLWGLGMVTLLITSNENGIKFFDDSLHFVKRQLLSSLVGFMGMLCFAGIDIKIIRKMLPVIFFTSVFLCFLTFIPKVGVEINGAKRWIRLPLLSTFQPSELLKFASVLYISNLLDKQLSKDNPEDRNVFPAVAGLVFCTGLVFAQKDFSTGLFIFVVGLSIFFVSGAKMTWFLPLLVLGGLLCSIMIFTEPYRLNRILGFLEQDKFLDTVNFQPFRAKIAISNGGIWGQGFGTGLLKVRSIPEVQADYIFAGWVESTGFVGVLLYFAILALFVWRGFCASIKCPDRFASFLCFGFVISILIQSMMNIGVVGGVVPSTGIPLPFFSSGGSSIIITLCSCGLLFQTSRIEADPMADFEKQNDLNIVDEDFYE